MAEEPPIVEPLGRGYKRLPEGEQQIADALNLEPEALLRRARERLERVPGRLGR